MLDYDLFNRKFIKPRVDECLKTNDHRMLLSLPEIKKCKTYMRHMPCRWQTYSYFYGDYRITVYKGDDCGWYFEVQDSPFPSYEKLSKSF